VAKKRGHDEEAWRNAKKICRLTARQLDMARRLGLNPKKLPRLRPGPQERWKLPVGEFIEALYCNRFGVDPVVHLPRPAARGWGEPVSPHRDADARELAGTPPSLDASRRATVDTFATSRVDDLVCYFTTLADDL
jgi:hypothetical protein